MKIITNLNKDINQKPKAIAIGSFDGVHPGHQAVINKLLDISLSKMIWFHIYYFLSHCQKNFFEGEGST